MKQSFPAPAIFVLATSFAVIINCCGTTDLAGGASEETNASISGMLLNTIGRPSANTSVQLSPVNYNPLISDQDSIYLDTTDNTGGYAFTNIDSGTYIIEAVQLTERTKALSQPIHAPAGDIVKISAITLKTSGTVRIPLYKPVDTLNGYMFIPGTSIYTRLNHAINDSGYVIIDSVPASQIPSIAYAVLSDTTAPVIFSQAILINPDSTTDVQWGARYDVSRAVSKPVIDGFIDEFVSTEAIQIYDTLNFAWCDIRIMWDDSALYIGVNVQDVYLNVQPGYSGEELLSSDDAIEIMVDRDRNRGKSLDDNDVKFYVNVLGRSADELSHDTTWDSSWKTSVRYQGTVNDNGNLDIGYVVEIAIPWNDLGVSSPASGVPLVFDIALDNCHTNLDWSQTAWANKNVIPETLYFNIPSEWGELILK